MKKGKYISIRKKMLISLVLISLVVTACATAISYLLAKNSVSHFSLQLCEKDIYNQGSTLENDFRLRVSATDKVFMLPELRQIVVLPKPEGEAFNKNDHIVRSAITSMLISGSGENNVFDFVGLYLNNGYRVENTGTIKLTFPDYKECITYFEKRGMEIRKGKYTQPLWMTYETLQGQTGIVYVRFLYSTGDMTPSGVAIFGVSQERILNAYKDVFNQAYVVAENGLVLSSADPALSVNKLHPNADQLLQQLQEVEGEIGYTEESTETNVVFYMPIREIKAHLIVPFDYFQLTIQHQMGDYVRNMVLMGAGMIAVSLLLALALSSGMAKGTTKLVQFTKKVRTEAADLRFEPESNDEIALLGGHINEMLDDIENANNQRMKDLSNQQIMEIQLLQQQINPHLLYNTLDSVLWALQQRDDARAQGLVESLSEFFKLSLSQGRRKVALEEELELIKYYLDVQNMARDRDFRMVCNVQPQVRQSQIYKLTLQPLVENSVIHGFSGYRDDGTITINGWCEDDILYIDVMDDGIGMGQEEVDEINQTLRLPTRPENAKHFGLYNIHSRIVYSSGADFGLEVESEVGGYTVVHLKMRNETA